MLREVIKKIANAYTMTVIKVFTRRITVHESEIPYGGDTRSRS